MKHKLWRAAAAADMAERANIISRFFFTLGDNISGYINKYSLMLYGTFWNLQSRF